jgi:hypothetical protein
MRQISRRLSSRGATSASRSGNEQSHHHGVGGAGFLGNRSVRHLRNHEFPVRIASRHPDGEHRQSGPQNPQLQSVEANIHDERSVADALVGAYGAINPVSLLSRARTGDTLFQVWNPEKLSKRTVDTILAGPLQTDANALLGNCAVSVVHRKSAFPFVIPGTRSYH